MEDRKEELKKALNIQEPTKVEEIEEIQKVKGPPISIEALGAKTTESVKSKGLKKPKVTKWFWILLIAFIIFLILVYGIKPHIGI